MKHLPNQRMFKEMEEEPVRYQTMTIWAGRGDKVRFMGENGTDCDKAHSSAFLNKGEVYTVQKCHISSSYTSVELVEIPNKCFNSVHFKDVSINFIKASERAYKHYGHPTCV